MDEVKINATPVSSLAKVTSSKTAALDDGMNRVVVTVEAQNGDVKEFVINIYREGTKKKEKKDKEEKADKEKKEKSDKEDKEEKKEGSEGETAEASEGTENTVTGEETEESGVPKGADTTDGSKVPDEGTEATPPEQTNP